MSISTIDRNRDVPVVEGRGAGSEKNKERRFVLLALGLCFLTSLLLCWRTNFSNSALQLASMFDSGKYVSSSESVMNATSFIHHFTRSEWQTICSVLKEPLMMDGPILPLVGAAWFTLIQKTPDLYDMRAALALQALLHALSACGMFVAARRILNSNKWALFAGLLWATYPSAVLGAGRFMSENITSLFLILMICLVPKQLSDKYPRSFALGLLAAAVGLLKAALLPGILLGLAIVSALLWINSTAEKGPTLKKLALHSVSLMIGALFVLAPWLLFTKEATGSYSITAQREPVLNIVIGGNHETDGWSGNPETDFVKLFDTKAGDKAGIFVGIWKTNFSDLSNIAIRRITRLWSSPWNDCLSKYIGLTLPVQWVWHQFILCSAVCGALILIFKRRDPSFRTINPIIGLAASILAAHIVYLVFNASPRQAFTSMPFFVLLACAAIFQISCSDKKVRALTILACSFLTWLAAASLDLHSALQIFQAEKFAYVCSWLIYLASAGMCSYALVTISRDKRSFLPSFCLQIVPAAFICAAFAMTPKIVPEWQCDLEPGMRINRTVSTSSMSKPDWAVLVVDGNQELSKSLISVNGHRLTEALTPLFTLTSNKDARINYQVFAGVSNKNPEALRQWRAAVVPLAFLKQGNNDIAISADKSGATVYGAFTRQDSGKLIAPTLFGFSGCKLLSETQPILDARYSESLTNAAAKGRCWLTKENVNGKDLSPAFGEQSGQYRAFLCLGFDKTKKQNATAYDLHRIELESAPIEISQASPFVRRYRVPKNLGSASSLNIAVSGSFQAADKLNVSSKVDVRNLTNLGSDLRVLGSVQNIQQTGFEVAGDLPTDALSQGNQFFEITFTSKQPVTLEKLTLVLTPRDRPDFAKAKVAIY